MVAAPRALTTPSGPPPLFGRGDLLDWLRQGLAAAREGKGRAFWLVGETGVGKSAIVSSLLEEARGQGALTLEGRALPREIPQPFEPLKEALKSLSPSLARAGERGEGPLRGPWVPERAASPSLVPLGFLPWREGSKGPKEAPAEGGDRLWESVDRAGGSGVEEDRLLLFERIVQALSAAAREQCVVLALEDLQNADRGTLEFVRYLGHHLNGLPLALLLTSLPWEGDRGELGETLQALRSEAAVELQTVRPLTMDEVEDYLRWRNAGKPADPETVTRLFAESEGNPLFLERLALGERGRSMAVVAGEAAASAGIPERAPVGRRPIGAGALDGGSELAGKLLVYGALLGPEFPFQAVARMSEEEEERVAQALERLVRRGVLLEKPGIEAYAFRHPSQREEVLASLTETRRRRLHRRLAEVLEVMGPGGAGEEEWVRELAQHFSLGRQDIRAFEYNCRLFRLARPSGRVSEARTALERALEAVRRLPPEDREYRDQEREVLLQLGETLLEAGELRRSEERLKEAFVLFLPHEPHEAVQLALARTHLQQGKFPEAYRRIEGLVPPAHEPSPSPAGIEAAGLLAEVALALGRSEEALARGRVAIGMAEATPDPLLLSDSCRRLAEVYLHRGEELERSRALYQRAQRILADAGEPLRLRRLEMQLALLDHLRGRTEEANRTLEQLARWAGHNGARLLEGEVLLLGAHHALELGVLDRATTALMRAREVLPPEEGPRFELQYRLLEGRHAHQRGEMEYARFQLARGESLARSSGVPLSLFLVLLASAELELARGDKLLARRLLEEARGTGAGKRPDHVRRMRSLEQQLDGA